MRQFAPFHTYEGLFLSGLPRLLKRLSPSCAKTSLLLSIDGAVSVESRLVPSRNRPRIAFTFHAKAIVGKETMIVTPTAPSISIWIERWFSLQGKATHKEWEIATNLGISSLRIRREGKQSRQAQTEMRETKEGAGLIERTH